MPFMAGRTWEARSTCRAGAARTPRRLRTEAHPLVVTSGIPVPGGTAAGARLSVWTTRAGQPAAEPLNGSQVASLTLLGEAAGVTALAIVLALAGVLARWTLNRYRLAAWDADWEVTGPRWTTRA